MPKQILYERAEMNHQIRGFVESRSSRRGTKSDKSIIMLGSRRVTCILPEYFYLFTSLAVNATMQCIFQRARKMFAPQQNLCTFSECSVHRNPHQLGPCHHWT